MRDDIPPEHLVALPVHLWNQRWFLLAAGDYASGDFNVMTVSWGGLGVMWNKPLALVVVRPTRHTRAFMDRSVSFTLSVLPESHRRILNFCGSRSGRDEDKVKATGLTPLASRCVPAPSFEEAELVLECRTTYFSDLDPTHFLDPSIEQHYPAKDYHRVYFGEILAAAGTAAWSSKGGAALAEEVRRDGA